MEEAIPILRVLVETGRASPYKSNDWVHKPFDRETFDKVMKNIIGKEKNA